LKNSNPPAIESGFQRAPKNYSQSFEFAESGSEQVPAGFLKNAKGGRELN
jgi:hypothetical protein